MAHLTEATIGSLCPDDKPSMPQGIQYPEPRTEEPTTPAGEIPEAAPEEKTRGIPLMITQAMKQRLRDLGWADDAIADMTPGEAWKFLGGAPQPASPEIPKPPPSPPLPEPLPAKPTMPAKPPFPRSPEDQQIWEYQTDDGWNKFVERLNKGKVETAFEAPVIKAVGQLKAWSMQTYVRWSEPVRLALEGTGRWAEWKKEVDTICREHKASTRQTIELNKNNDGMLPWESTESLVTDERGNVKAFYVNVRIALRKLGITGQRDTFHHRDLISIPLPDGRIQTAELTDRIAQQIYQMIVAISHEGRHNPRISDVHQALQTICADNSFDPVAEYLAECQAKWDGVERLDRLFLDYFQVEETPQLRGYVTAVARMSLIGAVRRVRQPGAKHDEIVVLESPQGYLKSSAIEVLFGPDNYTDTVVLGVDERRQMEAMQGKWVVELAELSGKSNADIDRTKAAISRKVNRARMAYDRHVTEQPRKCVAWATVNNVKYLRDLTGNRRWLPLTVARKIDLKRLEADRDQIWAEAATAEAVGESNRLPEHLWVVASGEQAERVVADGFDDIIRDLEGTLIKEQERIALATVTAALGYDKAKDIRPADRDRISQIMARHGWREENKPFKIDGHPVRGFKREPRAGVTLQKGYQDKGLDYNVLNAGVKTIDDLLCKLEKKSPRKYIMDRLQELGNKPDVEIDSGFMELERWARDESEGRHHHLPAGSRWMGPPNENNRPSDSDVIILVTVAELLKSTRVRAHEKWSEVPEHQQKSEKVTRLHASNAPL
jgi:predicted P-loop ATPase